MYRYLLPLILIAGIAGLAAPTLAEERPWIDMQGCSICKHMGEHMDIMSEVTWETHKTAQGMLSASVVPKKHKAKMDQMHEKMMEVASNMEAEMPLCGFCHSYAELQAAGAKSEEIKTDFGMISLMTSDDPELVKKIHEHADRTVAEYKKFLASQATAQ